MTDSTHGMALVRRVLAEHRRIIIPLAIGLVVNLIVYGVVVYPLAQRVANVTQRDQMAEQSLSRANAEYGQASGTLTGKARASRELTTFYTEVLPKDLSGARRLTYLRLAQLARESNLRFESGSYKPVDERGSTLTRLKIELVLGGTYADIRNFIHALESAPEFVVIDNVELAEGAEGGNLVVTLELSTYYPEHGGVMTPKAKRQALIAGGVVILGGAVYMNRQGATPATGAVPPSKSVAQTAEKGREVPLMDVQLELLKGERAEVGEPERNPFRFQQKAAPPAPPRRPTAAPLPPPTVIAPPVPQGPPPPPPIPLRFIGLVDAPSQGGHVAILSDGRGNVFYGKEGDIIEGRYRLLRVGPDAADIAFTDGRGRQTIRLSGQ